MTKNRALKNPENNSSEKPARKPGRRSMPSVVVAQAHYIGTCAITTAFEQAFTLQQNKIKLTQ